MATSLFDGPRTMPMTVSHVGFLLSRLGKDCHPMQQYRELTENAIQAILRTPERTGTVAWDIDWSHFDVTGNYKIACIDTGDGMTGPQMVEYINKLSSSIEVQGIDANFGIGAKIAALTRNPEGMIYRSWQDSQGYGAVLWHDKVTGDFGLVQDEIADGLYDYWQLISDEKKPRQVGPHGTMVTLMGEDDKQDTADVPKTERSHSDRPSDTKWLRRYLNKRYFQFPEGIEIKVREGYRTYPREDTRNNTFHNAYGMEYYLEKYTRAKGSVRLSDAIVHWWVWKNVPDDGNKRTFSEGNQGICASRGHMAALYHDELYEMAEHSVGIGRLQQFGILHGTNDFVLYIQPVPAPDVSVTSNTARTHLLLNQQDLPWERWAIEFRKNTPTEVSEIVNSYLVNHDKNADNNISLRLAKHKNLFKIKKYRPLRGGQIFVQATHPETTKKTRDTEEIDDSFREVDESEGEEQARRRRARRILSPLRFLEGEKLPNPQQEGNAEEVWVGSLPEVRWVTTKDNTRIVGDMEDRAAKYILDLTGGAGEIQANADFRGYISLIDSYTAEYQSIPNAAQHVESVVREWFQQTLIETIAGLKQLQGGKFWAADQIEQAWSEAALTAAVMPRYLLNLQIKRTLGSRLGTIIPTDESHIAKSAPETPDVKEISSL